MRVDYNFSAKDRLSARYNANKSLTKTHFGVGTGQIAPSEGLLQSAKVTYTRTFSPTLVNEASFGFNRMHIDPRGSIDPNRAAFPVTSVGGMASIGPALFDLSMVGNSFHLVGHAFVGEGTQPVQIRNADHSQSAQQGSVLPENSFLCEPERFRAQQPVLSRSPGLSTAPG